MISGRVSSPRDDLPGGNARLSWTGVLLSTDSCSTELNHEGSGLAAGRSMQSLEAREYGPGAGHRLMTPGGGWRA